MAQRGIREYDAKKLISKFLPEYLNEYDWAYDGFQVNAETLKDFDKLAKKIKTEKVVAKPDQLFGKRGKNNLIFIGTREEAKSWIQRKLLKKVKVFKDKNDKGTEGVLTDFVIDPCIDFEEEHYIAIKTERLNNVLYFSKKGGVDIEENWDSVIEIEIPLGLSQDEVLQLLQTKLKDIDKYTLKFFAALHSLFVDLNFSYLELNPFAKDSNGQIVPLDAVAKVDDTAFYDMSPKWSEGSEELGRGIFPEVFGETHYPEELFIKKMDEKSGSSMKLKVLNPNGRIWMLTAGGGASVIYADTVADLGYGEELGNYGEYSGDPTTDETEAYTDTVIKLMLKSKPSYNPKLPKTLIIGGGIANFTDVSKTFDGIIKAIEANSVDIKKQGIKIFVRRGGPNYKKGLSKIEKSVKALNIPIDVYGPEMHMTKIVSLALNIN